MVARCAGIVLTGGASRRLGRDKATLRVDGETLAARAARVLGAVALPLVEVGPGYTSLAHVSEQPAGSGPLAALGAGLTWLRAQGHRGPTLVLGVDLPCVEVALLRLLADQPGDGTVIPMIDDQPQLVCARYGVDVASTADALLARGDRSLRSLLAALVYDVLGAEDLATVGGPDVLTDVDTLDDARRLGILPPAGA